MIDGLTAERDTALEELKAANAKVASLTDELATANTNLETATTNLMTATGRVTELETFIGDEMDPAADSLRGMLAQANMDLDEANTALQMALDNSADVMEIDRLTKAVTAAEGMRDGYKTDLDAANLALDGDGTSEGLRDKVTRLEGLLKAATDALAKAAADKVIADKIIEDEKNSDMAKAVHTAIGVNTDLLVAPDTDPAAVKLAALPGAGMVTATLLGYTMTGAAPEPITGWRGATLEKDGDTTVIYTNIENEVPTAFDKIYAPASTTLGAPQAHLVTDSGEMDNIKWSDVKRADMSRIETPADSTDADNIIPQLTTFAGSVRGVDGTFSCTGTSCDVPILANGVLSSSNLWSFAPTESGAEINVKDTAYVSFGWWLNAMGTDGDYVFDAFASAEGMMANTESGTELEGSATYKGGAAGKYAMQSTTDDSASGGHFTAAATLTANFDASTVPTNPTADENGVSIGGSITDFMTGDVSRPNWKVTLTAPDATTEVGSITGAATKWTTGGAVPGIGTWSAEFHGEDDDDHPMAATGEFNAGIGGGDIARISGAFAATKQ